MSCALDEAALARQLTRFTRIGEHALWARRHDTELTVVLDADLDDDLLQNTLEIERDCCPFLAVIWDEHTRELTIAAHPDHGEVLARVANALAVAPVA
jgi:hypothetical protein